MITKTKCGKIFHIDFASTTENIENLLKHRTCRTPFSHLLGDKSECHVRHYGGQKQLRKPGR